MSTPISIFLMFRLMLQASMTRVRPIDSRQMPLKDSLRMGYPGLPVSTSPMYSPAFVVKLFPSRVSFVMF